MRRPRFLASCLPCATALAGLLFAGPAAAKVKWKDVDKTLLAETQGIVDRDAPSEIVLWEIHLTDTFDGDQTRSEIQYYRRVKIFNERGRDREAQVEIPYSRGERIDDVFGRTIQPSGTIVELKKEAIFDRTTVKAGGLKGKAKSFAMPAVEPGSVIEYQWRSVRLGELSLNLSIPAQLATPIRSMIMVFKPLTLRDWPYELRVRSFLASYPEPEKGRESMTIRLQNIAAIVDEPYMPPTQQVRPWFFIDYTDGKEPSEDSFWNEVGRKTYEAWKPYLSVTPSVRAAADSITAGVTDPMERMRLLHDFCRTRIRNVYDDAYDFTDADREKLFEDRKRMPEETLRRGQGTADDINLLLVALAQAAGYPSRIAVLGDRSELFFQRGSRLPFQLSEHVVAVQLNGTWKFYDPAIRDASPGMLPWWEESQDALILDPEKPVFVDTPLSLPSKSLARRAGRLRLEEDGTLEGEVSETHTGHLAARRKEDLDERSLESRVDEVRKELRAQWASASVESIQVTGVDDPTQPFGLTYKVTIPGYAERAGKRLLLQPGLFERGKSPPFTSSTRTHWLYFHHPWSEEDSISIELPPGYVIEADAVPEPLALGRTMAHRMAVETEEHVLRLHRYFAFGLDGMILIDPSEYARVKKAFDGVHERDGYTVALRPAEGGTVR